MDVTFGFMFRIDSYPPVAPVPPANPAPVQSRNHAPIEAEIVNEVSATTRNNPIRSGAADYFSSSTSGHSATSRFPSFSTPHSPLTYNQFGAGNIPKSGGTLLDIYA